MSLKVQAVNKPQTSLHQSVASNNDAKKLKRKQTAQMMIVMGIPVLALIAMVAVSLATSLRLREDVRDAQGDIEVVMKYSRLESKLQAERGLSSTLISAEPVDVYNMDIIVTRLIEARQATDLELVALTRWYTIVLANQTIIHKDDFLPYLNRYRTQVDLMGGNFDKNMQFYNDIIIKLMDTSIAAMKVPHSGDVWMQMVAYNALFRGADTVGIHRALGASYFIGCHLDRASMSWFLSLAAQTKTYLDLASQYFEKVRTEHDAALLRHPRLQQTLVQVETTIADPEYVPVCLNLTVAERSEASLYWFDNMTIYMGVLSEVRYSLQDSIMLELETILSATDQSVIIYVVVMIVVSVSCVGLGLWYASCINSMTSKIQKYSGKVSSKTKDLKDERKKMDMFLQNMLPKSVAEQLKKTGKVEAKFFDECTIYFSEVVGFHRISAECSPREVVDLLGSIYNMFDDVIDKYDVYKAETISDAYMIVSGVPEKNDDRHASEIAFMSLHLLSSFSDFRVPHNLSERLKLRIGVHSGSCVAGVVGKKMPRYCLFGDTVNTASRMESSGEALKIHISESTKHILDESAGFTTEIRGVTNIKGKGAMTTYWLKSHEKLQSKG